MSNRKKAASTIVKEQAEQIAELQLKFSAQIAELEKKLKTADDHKDMYYKSDRDKGAIIYEIHTMLDAFPFPPPRSSELVEGSYRSYNTLSLLARLTIFMARKDDK